MYKFVNNYETELTVQAEIADTSITVNNPPPSLGAGEFCRLTIQNEDATLFEIVDVTAIVSNTLIVTRGVEGSTVQQWIAGSKVVCSVTAEQLSVLNEVGADDNSWHISSTPNLNQSNGHKQKYTATANSTLTFVIQTNSYIDLLINPATYLLTWQDVTFRNGSPVDITASKENEVLIRDIDGILYGYIVSN